MGAIKEVVDEPGARSPQDYARRVVGLAVLYPLISVGAITGEILLVWRAKMLVTLTQRSNVETLVLAFFAIFFAYVGLLAMKGALAGVRILAWHALARLHGREAIERSKHAALGPAGGKGPLAALNVVVERVDLPGRPFSLRVADGAGTLGRIEVDGARVRNVPERRDGSSNLLAYFAHQVGELAGERQGQEVDVVAWGTLEDEETHRFLGLVSWTSPGTSAARSESRRSGRASSSTTRTAPSSSGGSRRCARRCARRRSCRTGSTDPRSRDGARPRRRSTSAARPRRGARRAFAGPPSAGGLRPRGRGRVPPALTATRDAGRHTSTHSEFCRPKVDGRSPLFRLTLVISDGSAP